MSVIPAIDRILRNARSRLVGTKSDAPGGPRIFLYYRFEVEELLKQRSGLDLKTLMDKFRLQRNMELLKTHDRTRLASERRSFRLRIVSAAEKFFEGRDLLGVDCFDTEGNFTYNKERSVFKVRKRWYSFMDGY